jgi:type IV secretory pathway TrbL component
MTTPGTLEGTPPRSSSQTDAAYRRAQARVGGLAVHVKYGSDVIAARARAGFRARFEREADPTGELPASERSARATLLMRLHMARLALTRARKRFRGSQENTNGAAVHDAVPQGGSAPDASTS